MPVLDLWSFSEVRGLHFCSSSFHPFSESCDSCFSARPGSFLRVLDAGRTLLLPSFNLQKRMCRSFFLRPLPLFELCIPPSQSPIATYGAATGGFLSLFLVNTTAVLVDASFLGLFSTDSPGMDKDSFPLVIGQSRVPPVPFASPVFFPLLYVIQILSPLDDPTRSEPPSPGLIILTVSASSFPFSLNSLLYGEFSSSSYLFFPSKVLLFSERFARFPPF